MNYDGWKTYKPDDVAHCQICGLLVDDTILCNYCRESIVYQITHERPYFTSDIWDEVSDAVYRQLIENEKKQQRYEYITDHCKKEITNE